MVAKLLGQGDVPEDFPDLGGPFVPIRADWGLSRRHGWISSGSKEAQRCPDRSVARLGAVFGDFDVGESLRPRFK